MNVVSLFDGMGCGRIALDRAGVPVSKYYASEVDKYAISVSKKNYPDMVHIGDVTKVDGRKLGWIDLLIGGSPCQGFSFAGKQLNFDDHRSKLFFEYVRILAELRETNPKVKFLLENVFMNAESEKVITGILGVEPIKINSALVSAQSRKRLYWTNIKFSGQPDDKGIVLNDILQDGISDRDKSHCLDANYWKGGDMNQYLNKSRRQLVFQVNTSKESGGKQPYMQNRVFASFGKSTALTQFCDRLNISEDGIFHRKLTVLECERLQTAPEGYTEGVSNTQRYKMLGNGWTVDVIAHIFKGLHD